MSKKFLAGVLAAALSGVAAGCGGEGGAVNTANTSSNANTNTTAAAGTASPAAAGARTAPDGSEIRTETAGGATTETRTFRDPNSRVERVVVTTRDGRRTARVYYRDRTVRELPEGEVERALDATADALVSAGGTLVDATREAGSEVGDKAEDVKDQAVGGAKKVGSEAADKAEDAGDKAASGAKKAGRAAVKGAKKAGDAVKDAVTP